MNTKVFNTDSHEELGHCPVKQKGLVALPNELCISIENQLGVSQSMHQVK